MIDQAGEALRCVHEVACGRGHLGKEHVALGERLVRAEALLGEVIPEGGELSYFFLADRIVIEAGPLVLLDEVRTGMIERLRNVGADVLVLRSGIDVQGLERLLDVLDSDTVDDAVLCGDGYELRRVASESDVVCDGVEDGLCSQPSNVQELWQNVQRGEVIDISAIEHATAGILTSGHLLPGSLIDLVQIREHDEYTLAHTVNVSVLASALGQTIGVSGQALEDLTMAALLHDVGKQEVSGEILRKRGALTPAERKEMERHPSAGARLLLGRKDIPALAAIVAYEHHLRVDGSGYPDRGAARKPNLASQIVQIADIFDALCTNRPYREAMPMEEALSHMQTLAGTSFDVALFEVFAESVAGRVPGMAA